MTFPPDQRQALSNRRKLLAGFCLLSLLTFAVYSRALFSFFLADDFMILAWLRQASAHPDLLWGQFTGPWMGILAVKYYRPVSMFLWFIQYCIWKENSLAFLLVNFLLLFSSSCLVMLIARELEKIFLPGEDAQFMQAFPLCAFGCFALRPLHPEAVVWMCNAFVLFETFFSLISILLFLQAQRQGNRVALCFSAFSFVLALLCKESAVVTPVIITILAILMPARAGENISARKPLSLLKRLRPVGIFWIVLAVYLMVRRLALGEFVGGWPANVSMYHNPIKEFLFSLWKILVPLSSSNWFNHVIGPILWLLFVLPILTFAFARLKQTRNGCRLALSILFWLICAIIPPYRFFLIDSNLLHSVFAYPSSVPVSLILAAGIAGAPRVVPRVAFATVFFLFCAAQVWLNSTPWYEAGMEAKQFVQQLRTTYDGVRGDPITKIVGLPGQSNGANVCLYAMAEIARKPFLSRDVANLSALIGTDMKFPVGMTRTMLRQGKEGIVLYRWQAQDRRLCQLLVAPSARPSSAPQFRPSINVSEKSTEKIKLQPGRDGDYELPPGALNCFDTVFLKVRLDSAPNVHLSGPLTLFFCNQAVPNYNNWDTCLSDPSLSNPAAFEYVFPLRDLPDWTFGGTCQRLKLVAGKKSNLGSIELTCPGEENLVPLTTVMQNGKALEKVAEDVKLPATISFDASRILHCTRVIEEIRTAVSADSVQLRSDRTVVWEKTKGEISLPADQKQIQPAYIRFRGQAPDGSWTGWWSDQVGVKN